LYGTSLVYKKKIKNKKYTCHAPQPKVKMSVKISFTQR
jgi:hypothetical protein